jgi:hypothetical protein
MTLAIGWLHDGGETVGTWLHQAGDWQVPLATLMEPPIAKMMEPGGGTQRPKDWSHGSGRESSAVRRSAACGGEGAAWAWSPEPQAEARPSRCWV